MDLDLDLLGSTPFLQIQIRNVVRDPDPDPLNVLVTIKKTLSF